MLSLSCCRTRKKKKAFWTLEICFCSLTWYQCHEHHPVLSLQNFGCLSISFTFGSVPNYQGQGLWINMNLNMLWNPVCVGSSSECRTSVSYTVCTPSTSCSTIHVSSRRRCRCARAPSSWTMQNLTLMGKTGSSTIHAHASKSDNFLVRTHLLLDRKRDRASVAAAIVWHV